MLVVVVVLLLLLECGDGGGGAAAASGTVLLLLVGSVLYHAVAARAATVQAISMGNPRHPAPSRGVAKNMLVGRYQTTRDTLLAVLLLAARLTVSPW